MKGNRRHSYQIYNHLEDPFPKTVINRKMFIIVDNKHKPVTHKDGHLLIFFRGKDARKYIQKNKANETWKEKRISLDITML